MSRGNESHLDTHIVLVFSLLLLFIYTNIYKKMMKQASVPVGSCSPSGIPVVVNGSSANKTLLPGGSHFLRRRARLCSSNNVACPAVDERSTYIETLNEGIASFYDSSTGLWEEMWGDHLHHGYYAPGEVPQSNRQAQIDMIENVLSWSGVEQVDKVGLNCRFPLAMLWFGMYSFGGLDGLIRVWIQQKNRAILVSYRNGSVCK